MCGHVDRQIVEQYNIMYKLRLQLLTSNKI